MPSWKPRRNKGEQPTPLTHYVRIYVPSCFKDGQAIHYAKRNNALTAVTNFMMATYGGLTRVEGRGFFFGNGNVEHDEQVWVLTSFCSPETLEEKGDDLNRMLNSLAIELGQESIAAEVNGELWFYGPSESYVEKYKELRAALVASGEEGFGYLEYLKVSTRVEATLKA